MCKELEKLTNSSKSLYQECPKKFNILHEQGYTAVKEASYFTFGTAVHKGLETLYRDNFIDYETITEGMDPYDAVKIRALLDGYINKWERFDKVVSTEDEFSFPLVNPRTNAKSRTWELAGKIDAIVQQREENDVRTAVVEHKTTSDSIEDPACDYWRRLAIDPQISGYFLGADTLGHEPELIIYDVIKKPSKKPLMATPEDKRKYKKDGELYANQRLEDETPEDYLIRLREDIAENPEKYYQRKEIARMTDDLTEFLQDAWSVGKFIMESRNEDFWPRRISQCFNYGRCQFYGVCSKTESLEDGELFKKTVKNPELTKESENEF